MKNKHKLTTSLEKNGMSSLRKSTRCGSYNQIDKAVFHYFVGKKSQKVPTDEIILKGKALEFSKTLGIKEFKASDCWLNKWKKRYKYNNSFLFSLFYTTLNVFTKKFQHFSWAWDLQPAKNLHSVPGAKIDFFASYDTLHSACWQDIFNADKFGLFYQCLPSKTYHLSEEKCSGGKSIKARLTGMAATSATGEKLEIFVISEFKNPRCFKNVKQLPCRYRAQKKSWMTRDLFEE